MAIIAATTLWSTNWAVLGTALLVPFLAFCLLSRVNLRSGKKSYNLPPGPRPWPIVGNLPLLFDSKKMPHEVLGELTQAYGGIARVNLGAMTMIYVTDPEIIKECMTVNDQILANRPAFSSSKYLTYEDSSIALAPYGEHWRYRRRILTTEVLNQKRMEKFGYVTAEEVAHVISETFEAAERKESVNLHNTFSKAVMNMVTRISMGKRLYGSESGLGKTKEEISSGQKMREAIERMVETFPSFMFENFLPSLAWLDIVTGTRGKMKKTFKEVDVLLSELVEARSKQLEARRLKWDAGEGQDFLDFMLDLRDRGGADAKTLKDRNIKAMLLDFVGGGSETTTNLTEWTFAELLANPEILAKLQSEVDSVVGRDRCVLESDVDNMPYLHAVVMESLRLHTGPNFLPRSNLVDCKIAGYDIPANCFINIALHDSHRNDNYWEDPKKFKPERFLDSSLELTGKVYFYTPFGAGRRICPGYSFGSKTVHFMVVRFIQSFDWSLPNGLAPDALDWSVKVGLTVTKRVPLEALPTPRLDSRLYSTTIL